MPLIPVSIARSGTIASGQVGWPHLASGAVRSGHLGDGAVLSGSVGSGQIASGHLASGLIDGIITTVFASGIGSGLIASGAVQGFFGFTPNIASGTVGVTDFGSGAVIAGAVGSGAIQSGNVGSGQIGNFALSSGSVTSGRLGVTGTPDGTKFLKDDFTWGVVNAVQSGSVGSGAVGSGSIQGFFGSVRNIASGTVGVTDFGSGAVVANTVGSGAIVSGNIASGQVGQYHIASGSVSSGRLGVTGTPDGTKFLRDDFSWVSLGSGLVSGEVGSGIIASGSVQGFFGTTPNIASGTVGVFDFGSGAVIAGSVGSGAVRSGNVASGSIGSFHIADGGVTSGDVGSGQLWTFHLANAAVQSGNVASGNVGQYHLASGAVNSGQINTTGTPGNTVFLRGDFSWAVPTAGLTSGIVGSGYVASGAVQGFFGSTPNIASGTVGVFDFGSGAVIAGAVGSGAIRSGNLASGQVGNFAISSGSVTSGRLGTTGTPDGTKFLRDDFSWATAGAGLTSGSVGSGIVASGAVQGFFGTTPNIASGTVGVFDFGSGAVVAGTVGSGAIRSGNIASGQVGRFHHATPAGSGNTVVFQDTPMLLTPLANPYIDVANSGTPSNPGSNPVRIFSYTDVNRNSLAMVDASGLVKHLAQDNYVIVRNATGSTINKGQALYTSGVLGQTPLAALARADALVTMPGDGVAAEAIPNNTNGYMCFHGVIDGFDTSAFSDGDEVYVSPTTAGGYTTTRPAYPQLFGTILRAHATQGVLLVTPNDVPILASGQIGSGAIASGSIQGFFGARHIASGTVGVFDFGSGAVIAGSVGSGAIVSGNVASGQIGQFHLSDGCVRSGHVASGQVGWPHLSSGSVLSGTIASGQVGTSHLADNSVTSGDIASGVVSRFKMASGAINSGHLNVTGTPDGTLFLRDDFSWATAGGAGLTSGAVGSGFLASGSVRGFFGTTRDIASGTVGVFDFGSGAVVAGSVGSGAVVSGNVASGQIGTGHLADGAVTSGDIGSGQIWTFHLTNASVRSGNLASGNVAQFHLASGAVNSGQVNTTGTPDNTTFLRGDFAWAVPVILSGQAGSGIVASGAVQGFFGATRNIASGTVGVMDFGSGAVVAGTVGSGAVASGNIPSGQIGAFHLASGSLVSGRFASGVVGTYQFSSGASVTNTQYVAPFTSGGIFTFVTEEMVSGVRAVQITLSGTLRIAMASVSGRDNAVGVVLDNVLSGIQANVYTVGAFQTPSGMIDGSGFVGRRLYVGRSGQVVTQSGWFNSGGFLSGDVWQTVGTGAGSGAILVDVATLPAFIPGPIVSGDIGSGQIGPGAIASGAVQGFFGTIRHIASGTVGVFDLGSGAIVAGTVGSGAVVSGNVASGQIGNFAVSSGAVTSGRLGVTGTPDGTKFLRDDFTWQVVSGGGGAGLTSGAVGSGFLASGSVRGFFGTTRDIASGTVGVSDLGSGAVIAGTVGSGAVVSGNIASGQIGTGHLANGAVTSGDVASGALSTDHFASGTITTYANGIVAYVSGKPVTHLTEEAISGVRAVSLTESGNVRVAMAGVSGRMPAVGIVVDNVASGLQAAVYTQGTFELSSGLVNTSGYMGAVMLVGRSGHVTQVSGWFGSGGFASGDVLQPVAYATTSGAIQVAVAGQIPFVAGLILSGDIASGQVGWPHLASGAVRSGHLSTTGSPDGTKFLRDDFAWVANALSSGAVQSGHVGSGAIQGFFGVTRQIASGTVGVFDFGSGAIVAGSVGSGAVVSGNIASGQIGRFHIGSGQLAGFELGSGAIVSGRIASGQIGTGHLADGAVTSGDVASGQIADNHFASGARIDAASWFVDGTFTTAERISGGAGCGIAVAFTQSGTLQTAMASVSGRMPAVGVVLANVVSGGTATVFRGGRVMNTVMNFSGWMNQPVYVGRSGQLSASGAPNFSGDYQQVVGISYQQSGLMVQIGDALTGVIAVSGNIGSGAVYGIDAGGYRAIASGSVGTYDLSSGAVSQGAHHGMSFVSGMTWNLLTEEAISGGRFVYVTQSGNLAIAKAAVSGCMPAIGWVNENVASGIQANVYSFGAVRPTSGMVDFSGYLGKTIWVGRSGQAVQFSGSWNSGGFNVSSGGDFVQRFGVAFNSGAFLLLPDVTTMQQQLLGVLDLVDVVNRSFGV